MRGLGLDFVHPDAKRSAATIEQAYDQLMGALAHLAGVFTEHKGLTLTVHYRLAQATTAAGVKGTIEEAISGFIKTEALVVSPGKMAFEIQPLLGWNKGKAISRILSAYPQAAVSLFFGYDRPDEAGFAAVQDAGGIGVFVGPAREPTAATYRVDSPHEVSQVLGLLAQL